MTVLINGETIAEGNSGTMYHKFEVLIAYISRSETLHAGEILGSGTVGKGSGLEMGATAELCITNLKILLLTLAEAKHSMRAKFWAQGL